MKNDEKLDRELSHLSVLVEPCSFRVQCLEECWKEKGLSPVAVGGWGQLNWLCSRWHRPGDRKTAGRTGRPCGCSVNRITVRQWIHSDASHPVVLTPRFIHILPSVLTYRLHHVMLSCHVDTSVAFIMSYCPGFKQFKLWKKKNRNFKTRHKTVLISCLDPVSYTHLRAHETA